MAAPGRTLRDLAVSFGVSHETIRTVLRTGVSLSDFQKGCSGNGNPQSA
jgi:hypothetical protein